MSRSVALAGLVLVTACRIPAFYYPGESGELVRSAVIPAGRMVVAPVTVPDDIDLGERVPRSLDSLVATGLQARGFEIIPPGAYAAIWDSLTQAAGGFFDPYTGVRHEASYDSAVVVLFAELSRRFHPVAIAYPGLFLVEAELSGGFATWDGRREFFDLRVGDGVTVLGLSFAITVEDLKGEVLFTGTTGVRIVERYSSASGELVMVDPLEARLPDGTLGSAAARMLEPFVRPDSMVTDTTSSW